MQMEIWKDIKGFESKYQVSNTGKIRNKIKGNILRPMLNKGYEFVQIEKRKNKQVHRIVMAAFVGESDLTVDHIDCNSRNNNLHNLQYVTKAENTRLSFKRKTAAIGSDKNQSFLIEKDISHIRDERNKGVSLLKLANGYCVSVTAISMICNRKTWKHVR